MGNDIDQIIEDGRIRNHGAFMTITFTYEHKELVDITPHGEWILEFVSKTQSLMGLTVEDLKVSARKYLNEMEYYSNRPIRIGANNRNKPQRQYTTFPKVVE